jgi:hypothetical protein
MWRRRAKLCALKYKIHCNGKCGTINTTFKRVGKETELKIYKTTAVLAFLYRSENWVKKKKRHTKAGEMKFLKGCTALDKNEIQIWGRNWIFMEEQMKREKVVNHLNRLDNNILHKCALRQEPKECNDVRWPSKKWLSNQRSLSLIHGGHYEVK